MNRVFESSSHIADYLLLPVDDFHLRTSAVGEDSQLDVSVKPRIATLVRDFNQDAIYVLDQRKEAFESSRKALIPDEEAASLPPRALQTLDRYAVVDALALYYRNRTR